MDASQGQPFVTTLMYELQPQPPFLIRRISVSPTDYRAPGEAGQPFCPCFPRLLALQDWLLEVRRERAPRSGWMLLSDDEVAGAGMPVTCTPILDDSDDLLYIVVTLAPNAGQTTRSWLEIPDAISAITALQSRDGDAALQEICTIIHDMIHVDGVALAYFDPQAGWSAPNRTICEVATGTLMPLAHTILPHAQFFAPYTRRAGHVQPTDELAEVARALSLSGVCWVVPIHLVNNTEYMLLAHLTTIPTPLRQLHIGARLELCGTAVTTVLTAWQLRQQLVLGERRRIRDQQILDALPIGIFGMDTQGVFTIDNLQHRRITGVVTGMSLRLDPIVDLPTVVPGWHNYPDGSAILVGEAPHVLAFLSHQPQEALQQREADGAIFLTHVDILTDADGAFAGTAGFSWDITRQLQTEQTARQHALELDLVIEAIGDGIIIYDAQGMPVRYNAAALTLAHAPPTNVSATWLFSQVSPTHPQRYRYVDGTALPYDDWPIVRALRGEIVVPQTLRLWRLDDTEFIANMRVSPLRDPITQAITGAVSIFRDITDEVREQQLRDDFIGMTGHELQAPLASLVLVSQLMQRRAHDQDRVADLPRLAAEVLMHTRRMSRLVDEMLDLARITAGRFVMQHELFDLSELFVQILEDQAQATHRTFNATGLDQPILLNADPLRISQVLTNLLSNAMKYSPPDTVIVVEVRLLGDIVHWEVRDSGRGIASEHLARVFDPYYRVADHELASSGPRREGLGLGLFITRAIVQELGGRIWAESTLGVGTTFAVDLPLRTTYQTQEEDAGHAP